MALLMIYYKVAIGPAILWLPCLILIMSLTAFGVGIFIAGLGTFRKDFIFATPFLTQAWLFITPVIYPLSSVPEKWQFVYMLNPMVGIVEGFRSVLLMAQAPAFEPLAMSAVVTMVLLGISWPMFRKLSGYFADVL